MALGKRILGERLDDRFVLEHRGPKHLVQSDRAYAALYEEEPGADGSLISTAVIFLTNGECPFRCVMCDLWTNTLDGPIEHGLIPLQIRKALAALPNARQVKLYNAGSFFDSQAIPPEDDDEIGGVVEAFDRVIVEAHPAFLAGPYGDRCLRFRDRIRGRLEVAIGLETANEDVLARLNKRMTLDSFRRAAEFLRRHDIALRVFILLAPPFMPAEQDVEWACRSIDEAIACGATACSIIPTRAGNGTIDTLGDSFHQPRLSSLERVIEYGLSLGDLRVFADLWDVERFFDCSCSPQRAARLSTMNREQRVPERIECACGGRPSAAAKALADPPEL
jgi:hypothetical protein